MRGLFRDVGLLLGVRDRLLLLRSRCGGSKGRRGGFASLLLLSGEGVSVPFFEMLFFDIGWGLTKARFV